MMLSNFHLFRNLPTLSSIHLKGFLSFYKCTVWPAPGPCKKKGTETTSTISSYSTHKASNSSPRLYTPTTRTRCYGYAKSKKNIYAH
mmetsp:Transcript_16281/g.24134  ORF Transcript_16281/g.24134 Transcript_16281/m.24134 type:complete len:87 (-) Transcript_16281:282-542(-)